MRPIVFLHIPKTAGQTVHNALQRCVGAAACSPIRVHTQADAAGQMPPGYRLYSGHLDWQMLDQLDRPFVFTVLREPRARIASYYLYLHKEAAKLSPQDLAQPHRQGMRRILEVSADQYFFGGDAGWVRFIRDHYDNFYCSYLATRRVRGWAACRTLSRADLLDTALCQTAQIDRIYSTRALGWLEADLKARFGFDTTIADRRDNAGALPDGQNRWDALVARFESDAAARRLEDFAALDMDLIDRMGLRV